MKSLLPLLPLSLLLGACDLFRPPAPPPTAICPQGLSASGLEGQSLGAAAGTRAAVLPSAVGEPRWDAPRVTGEVLLTHAAGDLRSQRLTLQAVQLLSGVRTQVVTPDITRVQTPAGNTDQAFAARLEAAGLSAQPNFIYRSLALPNDPGVPGNGGVSVGNVNLTQTYLTRIRAQEAWTFLQGCGKTPAGAVTAVLDTGIDAGHPDLTGRVLSGQNFTGTAVTTDTQDTDGHGTGVAGLIGAATNNGVGLAGLTWSGQNLLPMKVLGSGGGTTAGVAQALNAAVAQGAKVINMSFGFEPATLDLTDPGDRALNTALNTAAGSAVLVAAAGNTSGDGVYFPASNANVIAVGAIGASNALACYSARPNATYPRGLDLVAPGGAGSGVCAGASLRDDLLVLVPTSQGRYSLVAGTSEAAPLVSGVAALVRAVNPALSAPETRALLLNSANTTTVGGQRLLDAEAAVKQATR